jgi:hypothetical protein
MQKLFKPILAILLISLALGSCAPTDMDEPAVDGSSTYSPILMKRSDLEQSVKMAEARTLKDPGKIYTYGNYIFISERYEGVHIIDNTDPSNPINIAFVVIPGCVDMAVKNNVMYVDNAVDLVSLSLADLNDIKVIDRDANVFPELVPPDMNIVPEAYTTTNRPANTIIIGWKKS